MKQTNFDKFEKILLELGFIDEEDCDSKEEYENTLNDWFSDDYEFAELFHDRINMYRKNNPKDAMSSIVFEVKTYKKLKKLRKK